MENHIFEHVFTIYSLFPVPSIHSVLSNNTYVQKKLILDKKLNTTCVDAFNQIKAPSRHQIRSRGAK